MTMQEKPKNENLAGKFADDCAEQLAKDDDWKGSEYILRPSGEERSSGTYMASFTAFPTVGAPKSSGKSYYVQVRVTAFGDDKGGVFDIRVDHPAETRTPAVYRTVRVEYFDNEVTPAAEYNEVVKVVATYLSDVAARGVQAQQ